LREDFDPLRSRIKSKLFKTFFESMEQGSHAPLIKRTTLKLRIGIKSFKNW